MTAHSPQWVGVVVGRLHALAFRVDATQGFAVVLQEVFGAVLPWNLVLHEGADLLVAVAVCRDGESSTQRGGDEGCWTEHLDSALLTAGPSEQLCTLQDTSSLLLQLK